MTSLLSKLGLGTGQLGFDQPPTGRGRPREAEARDILSIAGRSGLGVLEVVRQSATADSHLRAAMPQPHTFRMTLTAIRPDRGPDLVETELRAQMLRLGVERVDTILAPSATDLFSPLGPRMWDRLRALKDAGLCRKIGVPVYASDDPVGVARRFKPDVMQAPASLLDQRLLLDGSLATLADMDIEVHLRSIFLQGLLFLPPDRMPTPLKGAASSLSRVRRMIAEGKSDPMQAALGFALSRPEAAKVIVSVTTAQELAAMIAAAASPPPELDWEGMAIDDAAALNQGMVAA